MRAVVSFVFFSVSLISRHRHVLKKKKHKEMRQKDRVNDGQVLLKMASGSC